MIALGVVLVLAGLAVLVIEAHVSTAGVLGVAAVLAAAAGIGLIIRGSGAAPVVAIPVSVTVAGLGIGAVGVATRKVLVARRGVLRTGPSSLVGTLATVTTWSGDEGQVAADGTLWRARVGFGWRDDPAPVPGESVIIEKLDGLTLSVRRRQPWELDLS